LLKDFPKFGKNQEVVPLG